MTPDEAEWFELSRELGCVINNEDCGGGLQSQHITVGGRRLGHHYSYPLCKWHHHWDSPLPIGECFGKGSKPFENKHGNEFILWRNVREKIGFSTELPEGINFPLDDSQ